MNDAEQYKLPTVAEVVLNQLEISLKEADSKRLSDEDLLTLYSVFGAVLQRALDILERYQIIDGYIAVNKLRSLIEIKGEKDRCYRIYPRINFCPCLAFKIQVIEKKLEVTSSMDSGKALCSLLKALQFQESAVLTALPQGLKFTVEESKSVQASAYIPTNNFTEYHLRDDVEVIIKISIAVLAECLNMFGSGEDTSLKMYYRCEASPLLLVLQPQSVNNVTTDCEIFTQSAASILQLRDDDSPEVGKVVLKAPALLGILAQIERSSDTIELKLSPEHPNFSLITYGLQDKLCIDIPKNSNMVHSFSCEEEITLKYDLRHIRLIMKDLAISTKVVLRFSSNGLLLLQMHLEKDDQKKMYSEFNIVPLLDDR